ncbi:regulatory signaling modulator protein AmpE, partial [Salmonella enterica subsp. enterica serovar Montevideo]|nr:regulatory signaling modulator protein AmpE [Salmonella enterica subsp. enterica serovar Montevideo]
AAAITGFKRVKSSTTGTARGAGAATGSGKKRLTAADMPRMAKKASFVVVVIIALLTIYGALV